MNTRKLFVNARLIDPASGRDERGGLLVENGLIADVGPSLSVDDAPEGVEVIDCTGHVLGPGLVDMRAFVGEPGAEHRETIATATQAAAAGGVTTLVCMPDTNPAIDDPAIVDFLLRRARDTGVVRILPAAALTRGLAGTEMTEIGLLQEAGAVAFTDGARSVRDAGVFRRILTYARDFDALVMHHTEDPDLIGSGVMNAGELSSRLGLAGRHYAAEAILLERDMRLVEWTGCRYHAASVTCRASLDIIRRAKDMGLPVTCGATINHLSFNEGDIGDYRTFFKMSPPLRTEDDREALVGAVAEGLVDIIVSDHNPQDVDQKRQPFAESADGAIGVETMLVAGLRLVHAEKLTLLDLFAAMSTKPAKRLGLEAGRLARGMPADLVEIDLGAPWVLDPTDLKSRSKNTPFDGARLQGRVTRTVVGGEIVHEQLSV